MKRLLCFLLLIPMTACYLETRRKVVDPQLGYSAVFPVRILVYPGTTTEIQPNPVWNPARVTQQTPFGEIIWFSRTAQPTTFEREFTVEVGTLPPGNQGGTNREEILVTLKEWNASRFPGPMVELEGDSGPGFSYYHKRGNGVVTEGIVIFRRGRIHHARATASTPKDPKLVNFLRSFQVDP